MLVERCLRIEELFLLIYTYTLLTYKNCIQKNCKKEKSKQKM